MNDIEIKIKELRERIKKLIPLRLDINQSKEPGFNLDEIHKLKNQIRELEKQNNK